MPPEPEPLRIHPERTAAVPGGQIVRRCDLSTCGHCGEVIVRAMRAGRGFWQHLATAERVCDPADVKANRER